MSGLLRTEAANGCRLRLLSGVFQMNGCQNRSVDSEVSPYKQRFVPSNSRFLKFEEENVIFTCFLTLGFSRF